MYQENFRNVELIKNLKTMGKITFPVISIFFLYMLFKKC